MKKLGKSANKEKILNIKKICRNSGKFKEHDYSFLSCLGFTFKDQPDILLFIDGVKFFWAVDVKGKNAKLFLETSEIMNHLNDDNKSVILYNLDLFT